MTLWVDRHLALCLRDIQRFGLTNIRWLVCARCQDIGGPLLHGIAAMRPRGGNRRHFPGSALLVDPTASSGFVEFFAGSVGAAVAFLPQEVHRCFVVFDRRLTLDLTPATRGRGEVEVVDDPTIAGLYTLLFTLLASSADVAGARERQRAGDR